MLRREISQNIEDFVEPAFSSFYDTHGRRDVRISLFCLGAHDSLFLGEAVAVVSLVEEGWSVLGVVFCGGAVCG